MLYETGLIIDSNVDSSHYRPTFLYNVVILGDGSNSTVVSSIEAGEYVCVCYNNDNMLEQQQKINRYITDKGLNPVEIFQVDLMNEAFTTDNTWFELQILIEKGA